jgi:murein DD-endopeptidase MepM/ murein hydrolase activator NlpD
MFTDAALKVSASLTRSNAGNKRAVKDSASENEITVVQTVQRSIRKDTHRRFLPSAAIILSIAASIGVSVAVEAATNDGIRDVNMQIRDVAADGYARAVSAVTLGQVNETTLDFTPGNNAQLLAMGIVSTITNANEAAAEAMQVQAELDAAAEARLIEAQRIAVEAEIARLREAAGAITDEEALVVWKQLNISFGQFQPPVTGADVTSRFGVRIHPIYGNTSFHNGLDLGIACGTPITAAANGVVEMAGWNGQLGLNVEIKHGDITTGYAHMLEDSIRVSVGQQVEQGQVIGLVGNTGVSTGCHVHWTAAVQGADGEASYFDPAIFLLR